MTALTEHDLDARMADRIPLPAKPLRRYHVVVIPHGGLRAEFTTLGLNTSDVLVSVMDAYGGDSFIKVKEIK